MPAEFRRNGATLSLELRAMEPGHLLNSALTCPSSADARCLKSWHPFVPAAQQLISLSENNKRRGALGGSPMERGVGGQPQKTPRFHPRHRHPHPGMTLPWTAAILRGAWVGHGPPDFCLASRLALPLFFLISRLSSFGWHMQGCQMRFVKIPAILSTTPDLSCVVIRKLHRENRENQCC